MSRKRNNRLLSVEETTSLPELPGLESVETADYSAVPVIFLLGGFSLFYVYFAVRGFLRYRHFIDTPGEAVIGLIVLCGFWFVIRTLSSYFYYRTDGSGLTIRGILRTRFIPWTEITGAFLKSTRTGETVIELKTSDGKLKILPKGFGGSRESEIKIAASIYQHLRKMNRAGDMQLPVLAKRFWDPVPDDIPQEMDWEKPVRWYEKPGLAFAVLFIGGLSVFLWFVFGTRAPGVIIGGIFTIFMMVILWFGILPEGLRKVRSVRVRDGCIEGTTLFGRFYVPWSDVTLAEWTRTYLRIRFGQRKREIWIPHVLGDRDSERLILCVVRQLRTQGNSQVIMLPDAVSINPEILDKPVSSDRQQILMKQAFINNLEEPARRRINILWKMQIIFMMLGLFAGVASGFSDLAGYLSRLVHTSPGTGTRFFISPDTFYVGVLLMVPGLAFGAMFGEWLGYRLAGGYREEWRRLQKVAPGRPVVEKTGKIFCLVALIAAVISVPLAFDCYARMTDKGIAINDFLSVGERFYPWSQVKAVEVESKQVVNHRKLESDETYGIRFNDGSSWRMSEDTVRFSRRPELREAIEFAAKKAGREITYR